MRRFLTILFFAMAAIPMPAAAQAPPVRLLSFEPALRVSKYWPAGGLQQAINDGLAACGKSLRIKKIDYQPGKNTADAIQMLRTCPAFQIPGEDNRRDVTLALWKKLLPATPPPTAADRINILILSFEGTDYDTFLWNVHQPADPVAWGTWGPFGATLGSGGEIQTIIAAIEQASPGLVEQAFARAAPESDFPAPKTNWREAWCGANPQAPPALSGHALLRSLATPIAAADKPKLEQEFCSDPHYRIWYRAFQRLGDQPAVRDAYDAKYRPQNRAGAIRLAEIYEKRNLPHTETDWAFFLDRATQFGTSLSLAGAALDALPATATPAQRRLTLSRASRPAGADQKRLRIGRDMSFVVDALGETVMDAEERAGWIYYGRRQVSAINLDDTASMAQPPF